MILLALGMFSAFFVWYCDEREEAMHEEPGWACAGHGYTSCPVTWRVVDFYEGIAAHNVVWLEKAAHFRYAHGDEARALHYERLALGRIERFDPARGVQVHPNQEKA